MVGLAPLYLARNRGSSATRFDHVRRIGRWVDNYLQRHRPFVRDVEVFGLAEYTFVDVDVVAQRLGPDGKFTDSCLSVRWRSFIRLRQCWAHKRSQQKQ